MIEDKPNDEIKEIDGTKGFYLCSPLLNTECMKENCYINNGPCCHTVNKKYSQQHLLDYITNLQQDNTMYAQLKDEYEEEIKELQQENERLKEELQQEKKDFKETNDYCFELKGYKSRIDKAIEYIEENDKFSNLGGTYEFYGDIDELLRILKGDDEDEEKRLPEKINVWYQYNGIDDKELTEIMLKEIKDKINEIIDYLEKQRKDE